MSKNDHGPIDRDQLGHTRRTAPHRPSHRPAMPASDKEALRAGAKDAGYPERVVVHTTAHYAIIGTRIHADGHQYVVDQVARDHYAARRTGTAP